ncbi:MAG TPA: dephospho-CoA kinase [Verrucomicrobiales bacterium]|nr:dephospho-CoA kinase [Verrucomicrobiales bacterium]|tara:strand:- start:420 stop:1004 length:585 start_codon:yes stop_codon:yes gene_type:complete
MNFGLYGLTGGVGMGKSTVSRLLSEMGITWVDSDDLARSVVEPGQPALDMIRDEFGDEYIGPQGNLDRSKMASLVFANEGQRKKLEGIIHPMVRNLWQEKVERWKSDKFDKGVVVIPLLFEVSLEVEFDRVICVASTGETQIDRLKMRGWEADQIGSRIGSQMCITEKMERSDCIIWNEGSIDTLKKQLQLVFT